VTVSNPAPFPGTKEAPYGSSRPSANLYSDSIVKLNKDTGKLEWYYQLTPHDINGGVWEAGHLRDASAS
jgi:alcohol dehydrogenase (cytochrome c)